VRSVRFLPSHSVLDKGRVVSYRQNIEPHTSAPHPSRPVVHDQRRQLRLLARCVGLLFGFACGYGVREWISRGGGVIAASVAARVIFDALAEIILPKTSREISTCACTENGDADGTTDQDYGDVASVALWRRPSRREETEELKDYIAELKEALQDAEERLKDLEK
jgi:hypothetical protein